MSDIKVNETLWILLSPRNLIAESGVSLQKILDHESCLKDGYKIAKVNLRVSIDEKDVIDPKDVLPDTGVRYDP